MSRKHVLHVIDALNHGGAQRLLVLLAEGIDRERFEMSVCVIQPDLTLKPTLEEAAVRVLCLQRERPSILTPHRFLAYVYRNIRDIQAFCRINAIDVVHCHLSDAEFLGILAGRLASVGGLLTTVHYPALLPERRAWDLRNWLRRLWTKTIYHRWTDWVVAVSEETAAKLIHDFGIHDDRVRVILNGVNLAAFVRDRTRTAALRQALKLTDRYPILVNVARLAPPKGQKFLLEAINLLVPKFPELVLLLAGDGESRGALEEQCARLGLDAHVCILGSRSDVAELLAMSDLFVFPSVSEGTSLALLEAMAAERAVVATAIPGNQEVIRHQENGYLVAPGHPEELAHGISFLLEHPDLMRTYGANARRFVQEHFDIRQTVADYEALWRSPRPGLRPKVARSLGKE